MSAVPTSGVSRERAPTPGGTRVHRPRIHGIWGFVVRRMLLGILTLFLVTVVVFAATQALPSDPARAFLGRTATPESVKQLRAQLGLNKSAAAQYGDWLRGVLSGNLGRSLTGTRQPVSDLIGKRVENSAFLMLLAGIVSIPFSIVLGAVAARRRDGPFDHASSILMLALAALPEFVVAIGLVVLFATTVFHVLPAVSLIPPGDYPWQHMEAMILPTAALVIAVAPYIARIMRVSMVEVLESDYVEMARLKGMPERAVLWRHAFPNGIAPAIQVIALNLAYLAGGIVVVEFVFAYPGIGGGFVEAVSNRDFPTVQALALMIAAVYVVLNVVADVATILVSPRLRTSLQ
jgi:peptide/nickel transport system permease protein